MNLIIHTDGGSLNNPGQAAYAFLIYGDGKLIHKQNERIGIASNNVAEYTALIKALDYVKRKIQNPKIKQIKNPQYRNHDLKKTGSFADTQDDAVSIQVISDSLLMVNQVKGIYKVKHPDIKPLHTQVKLLEIELNLPVLYTHVLRGKNEEADALVKEALGKV